ncbi:MAG: ABC transporter substrate-binding protein [Chloroflexi bacterium]|nr:ABC transporter substrate-binding protein [Chloroflexota bacterium]
MKRVLCFVLLPALFLLTSAYALTQDTVELRFLCFEDGNECAVYADLLAQFSEINPDIQVSVDVTAEEEMLARLQAAYDADEAYDIARSKRGWMPGIDLDLRPLLGEALTANFRPVYFEFLRVLPDDQGIYAFPDALGVVAPFVNVSLFEQAGVTLPGEGASWDEWLAALDEVVSATEASYALSVDNKDHRLVSPAMSLGAEYFDEDGRLTLPNAARLGEFLQILHGLMEAGKTPADTLLGTGKSQDYFVRGETVMYICGSWKVEEVAAQVGDDFAWAIVANPSGPAGGTGVVQATMLVAYEDTNESEAVAKVFAYLLGAEVSAEFAARTLTIPAREDLAASGIDYETDDEAIAAALNSFAREVPKLQDQAIALDLHPQAPDYYAASNELLRAYFAGELTLDEALAGLQARLGEAEDA